MIAARSVSTSSNTSAGSNASTGTYVPATLSVPSTASTHPPTWNSGIGLTCTSPGHTPNREVTRRASLVMPRWCSNAPLGNPVVPDV